MTLRVDYPIINRLGLHARPSAKFVSLSVRYPCTVWLARNGQRVNGKSIMGLMTLAAAQGTVLTLETDGEEDQALADALLALAADRFGEES